MSNLTGVINFFSTANEGYSTTLASTIASGATTVPLSNMAALTDGTVFVGIIEPGGVNQQTFTGTVSQASTAITGVIWTRGTNTPHVSGVTIVDYVTGTDFNMMSAGILKQHTQAGAHKAITNTGGLTNAGGLTTDTLHATGTTTLDGAISGAGYSLATMAGSCQFRATGTANPAWSSQTWTTILFNAESYDVGNNFNGTDTFTASIDGFYQFNLSSTTTSAAGNLQGMGLRLIKNGSVDLSQAPISFDNNVSYDFMNYAISDHVQLAAGDTIKAQGWLSLLGGSVSVNGPVFSGYLTSKT